MITKLKNFKNRAKSVLTNETGASNVEVVVWIVVCLLVAVGLYMLGNGLRDKLTSANNKITSGNYSS